MKAKRPIPRDTPAKQLTRRIRKAQAAYVEEHGKTPTQVQLAAFVSERAGVSVDQTTVGTWLQGTIPKPWFLGGLAEFYGLRRDWLAFGEGEMREAAAGNPEHAEREPLPPQFESRSPDQPKATRSGIKGQGRAR